MKTDLFYTRKWGDEMCFSLFVEGVSIADIYTTSIEKRDGQILLNNGVHLFAIFDENAVEVHRVKQAKKAGGAVIGF